MVIKNILLTGSSGFLGKYIYTQLKTQFELDTLGRNKIDDVCFDFSNDNLCIGKPYDLVIHCAGKAHVVPKTDNEKRAFFEMNVQGTQFLLNGLEKHIPPKALVFVSSVAVYGREFGNLINEECELLAVDPYGLSKVQAENLILNWCEKHNVICTILRLPLVVGTNPPGNLEAMIKGISKGYYFDIAGGTARKSMVLAKDVAGIIPKVASIGGIYNLTDGKHPSFSELSLYISGRLGKSKPFNIPAWIARTVAYAGDLLGSRSPFNSGVFTKITKNLTFDDKKAVNAFGWSPSSVLSDFKIN
ncbi:NAD-dependent epimerase/dehydratase family protein [Pedobacter africanus]|uniref:Nucleoside-diphosphate-sugar epimerase n=1 Tax=Pedobacter africanus TaxID=151894 RepID=A0A1W2BT79_9SPHI|nr:NAD-dependent epimerase/dehydratase family protein [Pedobacter africanus]SMC76163.1 Nucleoside-diphosphate-sugar epimerase [Pedobacter africanus]